MGFGFFFWNWADGPEVEDWKEAQKVWAYVQVWSDIVVDGGWEWDISRS